MYLLLTCSPETNQLAGWCDGVTRGSGDKWLIYLLLFTVRTLWTPSTTTILSYLLCLGVIASYAQRSQEYPYIYAAKVRVQEVRALHARHLACFRPNRLHVALK